MIKRRQIVVFIASFLMVLDVTAQQAESDSINHAYFDLKSALRNIDNVYYLDLSGKGLKAFPEDILKLKNLRVLLLGVKVIPPQKTKPTKGIPPGHSQSYPMLYKRKRNYIKAIPEQIVNLKQLKMLDLEGNPIEPKVKEKVESLLPDVVIKW